MPGFVLATAVVLVDLERGLRDRESDSNALVCAGRNRREPGSGRAGSPANASPVTTTDVRMLRSMTG